MALSRRASLRLIAALAGACAIPLSGAALAQDQPLPRRGDYLAQSVLQAGPMGNYAALHLRKPPAGYGWYHIGRAYVMASVATGLIVEVVIT
jgi:Ni/Co efflux regulator RcnB